MENRSHCCTLETANWMGAMKVQLEIECLHGHRIWRLVYTGMTLDHISMCCHISEGVYIEVAKSRYMQAQPKGIQSEQNSSLPVQIS